MLKGKQKKYAYYSGNAGGIGTCPWCRGVILKDLNLGESAHNFSFTMRCPHCKKDIRIKVSYDKDISISIEKIQI